MGKNKNWCTTCTKKHFPPTGKKCPVNIEKQQKAAANDTVEEGSVVRDSLSGQTVSKSLASAGCSTKESTHKKDLFVSGPGALGHGDLSASTSADSTDTDEEAEASSSVQAKILHELQRMNCRLDVVEQRVAKKSRPKKDSEKRKLSTVSKYGKSDSKLKSKKQVVCSDESSDDSDFPSLIDIKSSRSVQKKIDRSLDNLDSTHIPKGNDHAHKLKSKRGGPVEVVVNKKVAWPHEHILGGHTRQRVTYDQLSLTQFIQGFVKNIIDEQDRDCKDKMLHYLGDLMEDATDFSWSSAKSAHAVLLCEMERGSVDWFNTERIDRIRRAHAQRHTAPPKQSWQKTTDQAKKPWFCKAFQVGTCYHTKDHENNGKTHRHICVHCLAQGRILTHPEKDCLFAKKSNVAKNDQLAAQQN